MSLAASQPRSLAASQPRSLRTKRRLLAVLAACLFSALPAFPQPGPFGVQVPAGGGPMPNYFSGTNCRASGSAQVGEPLIAARLYLNDEFVASWDWAPGTEKPMSMALFAMFDSSHWQSGTTVEVKYKVLGDTSGIWYLATDFADTWNATMVFEHPDEFLEPDAAPAVEDLLFGSNYDSNAFENGGEWSHLEYLAALYGSNVVFYAGHGSPSNHVAGNNVAITPGNYETLRIAQIGTGIPPFNSGAPPVNFIHLDCCDCGQTNNFLTACYPYYMAWGGVWLEDQALLAYSVLIPLGGTGGERDHAQAIWSRMVEGMAVGHVKSEVIRLIQEGELELYVVDPDLRPMEENDLTLYDSVYEHGACRIKTVYTGDDDDPIGWYRQL